ncbi:MAG TPA: RidA family protein [Gemmatimonadaceae bacterium]|jgi:enamine deaminase RidA (YjgF/YER057c/UK114 family)|nr:RidA family protein [Gemmatimonadaceae bacterium]
MIAKPTEPNAKRSTDIPTVRGAATPIHPEEWPSPRGYTNGMIAHGRLLCVAGQIGWNPVTMEFESDDFSEQVAQTLRNVVAVLYAGGASPEHLVRLTWFITDKQAYLSARQRIGRVYREIIGRHFPPMSVIFVTALLEDEAQVEIEATAVVPHPAVTP